MYLITPIRSPSSSVSTLAISASIFFVLKRRIHCYFHPRNIRFSIDANGYRVRRPEGSVGDHILGQLAWGGHVGLLWSPSRPARNKVARLELRGCGGQWWEMVKKGWLDSNGWVFIDTSIVYWYICTWKPIAKLPCSQAKRWPSWNKKVFSETPYY